MKSKDLQEEIVAEGKVSFATLVLLLLLSV